MDPEILKKLGDIENRVGDIGTRLEKLESFSVKLGQRVFELQTKTNEISASDEKLNIRLPQPIPTRRFATFVERLKQKTVGLESYFGRWILGVVGFVAIVFGASFFLKFAFDNNWIPVTARVLIGLGAGVLFIIGGELMRRSQAKFANILCATGIGLLYLSTYAAYGYYELINASACFLFLVAVTIFGITLSLLTNSLELASLSAIMGFLIPYLFGLKAANDLGFFIYTLSLNIGILSIAFFKKWRGLTFLGFVGTVLHFSSWYAFYYEPSKLALAIYALTVFYLIYLAVNIVNKFIANEKSDRDDLIMLTLNPVWFFSELYFLLQPNSDTTLAIVAIGLGVTYIILAYIFRVSRSDDQYFSLFLGGVGAIFLTIAVPLYFNKEVITIAWAVEAIIVAILGAMTDNEGLKRASMGIFTIALIRFFSFDNYVDISTWQLIWNWKFFTYSVLIFTGAILAYFSTHTVRGLASHSYQSNIKVLAVFLTVVNLLILCAVTSEVNSYFNKAQVEADKNSIRNAPYLLADRASMQEAFAREDALRNTISGRENAVVSIFWTLYAILLILLGINMSNSLLRKSALILFVVTILKVFIFDLSGIETPYRIISFIVLGIILLLVSYLYFRREKRGEVTV